MKKALGIVCAVGCMTLATLNMAAAQAQRTNPYSMQTPGSIYNDHWVKPAEEKARERIEALGKKRDTQYNQTFQKLCKDGNKQYCRK